MWAIREISKSNFPPNLLEIPQPPKKLFMVGNQPEWSKTFLTIVGTREPSNYGISVVKELLTGLKDKDIYVVSGLALGIDRVVHEACLVNNLTTIAFPGSGLDEECIYPRSHLSLAKRIVENNGCLISEFPPQTKAAKYTFPQRNRLMAGISKATLVVEAKIPSGTLITSRLALEYNREVLAIPGSIFNQTSQGPNQLIKQGATPINNLDDLLNALNLNKEKQIDQDLSKEEIMICNCLPADKQELIIKTKLPLSTIEKLVNSLIIKGVIEEKLSKLYKV